jgi:hypothetical protein
VSDQDLFDEDEEGPSFPVEEDDDDADDDAEPLPGVLPDDDDDLLFRDADGGEG